jgi:hypothetical protein
MLLSHSEWKILNNFNLDEIYSERFSDRVKDFISPNKIIDKIKNHYTKLSDKYGKNMAKIIIAVALVGTLSPIPGSSIIAALPFVGLAEIINWIKSKPEVEKQIMQSHAEETKEIIKDLQLEM